MISVVENLKLDTEHDNLIGVSHSFAGACMYVFHGRTYCELILANDSLLYRYLAELYHPSLFDAMCLMDLL